MSPSNSTHSSIAVAVPSNADICSHMVAGTASSNPAVYMDICVDKKNQLDVNFWYSLFLF